MALDPVDLRIEPKSWLERKVDALTRRRHRKADEVIDQLYGTILEKKPAHFDGVVIDVKAREWKYENYCVVDDLIPTMRNPRHSYVRQIFTKEEREKLSRDLREYTS